MFSGSPPKFVWNAKHKQWDSIPAGESKLEQWEASFGPVVWSRLLRKRKLKLKFPTEEELLGILKACQGQGSLRVRSADLFYHIRRPLEPCLP